MTGSPARKIWSRKEGLVISGDNTHVRIEASIVKIASIGFRKVQAWLAAALKRYVLRRMMQNFTRHRVADHDWTSMLVRVYGRSARASRSILRSIWLEDADSSSADGRRLSDITLDCCDARRRDGRLWGVADEPAGNPELG
jgi:hypothetical protein